MKKATNLMLMMVLGCTMSAMAQSGMSSDSSMKKDDMGKKTTMTGCISEQDGKYMLMDKAHPNGVQLSTTEDLKPHVGHKVKITGMMTSDDSMKTDSGDSMKHDSMGMMKVSEMKMVSTSCDMSKMK